MVRASQRNVTGWWWDRRRELAKIKRFEALAGKVHGNPLQYSCLENPTDSGAWQATIHRITKSRTQLK